MSRVFPLFAVALCTAAATEARADPYNVGLGAAAGVAVPHANPTKFAPAFDWGFFVDIPLISTFSVSPSAIVYQANPKGEEPGNPNTDISLSFKFVVPVSIVDIFAGVTAGLTMSTGVDPHVGGLAGLSVQIFSNLEIFAQGNYRILFDGDGGRRNDLHVFAGPLFRFK